MSSIKCCMVFEDKTTIFSAGILDKRIIEINKLVKYFNALNISLDQESGLRILAISRGVLRLYCVLSQEDLISGKAMLLELSSVLSTEPQNIDKLYYIYNFYRNPLEKIPMPDVGPVEHVNATDILEQNESSSLMGNSKDAEKYIKKNDKEKSLYLAYILLGLGLIIMFGLCISAAILSLMITRVP